MNEFSILLGVTMIFGVGFVFGAAYVWSRVERGK